MAEMDDTLVKRIDWKSAAARIDTVPIGEQLRGVTAVWAAARQEYLELWDATRTDDLALRRAVRRFQDIDRLRHALADRVSTRQK